MKKTFLIIALLLVSFWCINVKADDDATLPTTTDPESAEIEVKKEEKVEEVKEEVKAPEVKAEPTRSDNKADGEGETEETTYENVKLKVIFKNVDPSNKSKTYEVDITPKGAKNLNYSAIVPSTKVNVDSESMTYTFAGFILEDYSSSNLTVTDNPSTKKIRLEYAGGTITNPEVIINVDWEKKAYPVVKFNIYDIKQGEDSYIVYTVDEVITPGSGHTKRLDLDQVFKGRTTPGGVTYSGVNKGVTTEVDINNGLKTFSFVGYYMDANRDTKITSSYTPTGTDAIGFRKLQTNNTQLIYSTNGGATEDVTINVYAHWDTTVAPILDFHYIDQVSTGTGSWTNNNGGIPEYIHKFRKPADKTHYQFLYWKIGEDIYNDGDEFVYSFKGKENNTVKSITAYAYWQPDVTLDLYDGDGKFISSESSFESVSINYNTERVGYNFLGWFDKDGNKVEETTFYPNELGTKPEPKQITLYAKYEEILINVGVTKVWDDEDNQDGIRPDSINVTLSNGTTVTLNEENSWTATVENVPEYKDGEKINYTWTEDEVEGYELTDTSVEDNITTLTNTHIPEVIEIIVNKVWADDDNESGKRPESVTVALVVDEEDIETVELNEEVEWTHTFKVPAYSNGEKIEYDVREVNVPEGYEAAYEGSIEDGFTIHNVLGQGEGEPENPTNNPQTGDNIYLYLITLIISMSGLGICVKEYALDK